MNCMDAISAEMMMSKLQPNEISHSESYNLCAANSYELSMNCVTEILYKKRIQYVVWKES